MSCGGKLVARLAALVDACQRPDGLDDAGPPLPEETLEPEPYTEIDEETEAPARAGEGAAS